MPQRAVPGPTLKLLTLNVHKGFTFWNRRFVLPELRDAVRTISADVVFLQSGQIVDAVLRWPGHRYSGQSSSPVATPPHGPARPGGDTLTVKSPSTP